MPDKRTPIPVVTLPSGQFAIGDNLGGPDDNTPDMEPVPNAPGWYRPAPPAPYAIHHRQRRDVVPPTARPDEGDSCRVAPEVHAVPTVTRRQRVTPADPVLEAMARVIIDSVLVSIGAAGPAPSGDSERAAHLGSAIVAGVRNGVMVVGEEIERLRGMLGDLAALANLIDPPGAPACFEVKPEMVRQVAKMLRLVGQEVGK